MTGIGRAATIVSIVVAALLIGGCGGTDAPQPASAPPVPAATTPTTGDAADSVRIAADLGAVPGMLVPLGATDVVPLTREAAIAIALRDPGVARFFTDQAAKSSMTVRLGRFVGDETRLAHDEAVDTTAVSLPTDFVAYVISGGSSECVPSGEPGSEQPPDLACTVTAVVDAERATVPWIAETG